MQQLRYTAEIRSFAEVDLGDEKVDDAELALAAQLVEQIASDSFTPENYSDGVHDQILAAIEQKIEGKEMTFAAPEEPKAQVIDLMAALKASLSDAEDDAPKKRKPAKKATSGAAKKRASKS